LRRRGRSCGGCGRAGRQRVASRAAALLLPRGYRAPALLAQPRGGGLRRVHRTRGVVRAHGLARRTGRQASRRRTRSHRRGLRRTTMRRLASGLAGGVVVPLVLAATTLADGHTTWLGGLGITLAFVLIVGGELLERSLFFTAASPPR